MGTVGRKQRGQSREQRKQRGQILWAAARTRARAQSEARAGSAGYTQAAPTGVGREVHTDQTAPNIQTRLDTRRPDRLDTGCIYRLDCTPNGARRQPKRFWAGAAAGPWGAARARLKAELVTRPEMVTRLNLVTRLNWSHG